MVETYFPKTWDEALKIRETVPVVIYAGGTDLMVKKKKDAGLLPEFEKDLLFIGKLKELKKIRKVEGTIRIGAACTYRELLGHPDIPDILKEAIREIASPAIRSMGTIGGNICNASPAGDTLPVLYALGSKVMLSNCQGSKEVPIEDFILGPGKTELQKDEILKEIIIPATDFTASFYKKVGARKADAISKLSFVGLVKVKEQNIEDIRFAFGAVGPTVIRNNELEDLMKGKEINQMQHFISILCEEYGKLICPIDDQRSTAQYRHQVSLRLLEHFIMQITTT